MTLEFRPTIESINIANECLTKITLEVKNGSLDGKYDDLRVFSCKTVNITIVPEPYSYQIPFDRSTNSPTQEYIVNNDGTIDFVQKEQTQLEVDEQGNIDIENRPFTVTKEIIDEFIISAKSLEFPGLINPRDALVWTKNGESFETLAEDYEMKSFLKGKQRFQTKKELSMVILHRMRKTSQKVNQRVKMKWRKYQKMMPKTEKLILIEQNNYSGRSKI